MISAVMSAIVSCSDTDRAIAMTDCVMQASCTESLTDMVNTMHQLSATTTFEELQLAATSITDIVGNLLQVIAHCWSLFATKTL